MSGHNTNGPPVDMDIEGFQQKNLINNENFKLEFIGKFYSNSHQYYITKQEYKEGVLGAEIPLDIETMENLAESFSDFSDLNVLTFKTFIPTNVLYVKQTATERQLIWFVMPQVKKLFFKSDLKIPCREYALPGIIFNYQGQTTQAFAFDEKEFFSKESAKDFEKIKLFNAPFHNIDGDGDICFGTTKDKVKAKKHWEDVMKGIEDMFFNSYFTHGYSDNSPLSIPLQDYYNRPESTTLFDYKLLVPNKNLKSLLK